MAQNKELLDKLFVAENAYEAGDMEMAILILTDLAKNGLPEACLYLGLIYKTGDGVEKDLTMSCLWYSKYVFALKKLSDEGDAHATLKLGKLYQYGNYVAQNEETARTLVTKAAQNACPEAQFHLSMQYLHGWMGCPADYEKYVYWLDEACKNNYPEAIFESGKRLILDGECEKGRRLIEQAASLGFWPAEEYKLVSSHKAE